MLQGTASDVGKSVLVAGLCRLAKRRGLAVVPFKPQNMSNNAAVCADGGEIGRAQALQARAAGIAPTSDMNPVLLKPETDRVAQVVVHGRPLAAMAAAEYMRDGRKRLLDAVLESFSRLAAGHDLVLVEGAGSPAEVNLRAGDIANMGFARAAGVPVCLVGDIDRGGVIASLVGTRVVLDADDAAMIVACLINRFRGDPRLFDEGLRVIEARTGWPCLGVVPWLEACAALPAEDAVGNAAGTAADAGRRRDGSRPLVIAAPMLSRLANFDDADLLIAEPGVDFRWIPPGRPLPPEADVVVLFGTKSTLGDLAFLRAQGWDHDLIAHARAGGRVLGLCGGYQLLGRRIDDPDGHDGVAGTDEGLGLLDVATTMRAVKRTTATRARCALVPALEVAGYEIHVGESDGPDRARPMFRLDDGTSDGARSVDGRVEGSYLHGVFASDGFRRAWLERAGGRGDPALAADARIETALDALADALDAALDTEALFSLARLPRIRR